MTGVRFAMALCLLVPRLIAQNPSDPNIGQLSGVRTVLVQVGVDQPVDSLSIRNMVEAELRRAGLRIVSSFSSGPDAVVGVSVYLTPYQTAMMCSIQLIQDAHLDRRPGVPAIARWLSRTTVANVSRSDPNRVALDAARDLATELANAWLSANPR